MKRSIIYRGLSPLILVVLFGCGSETEANSSSSSGGNALREQGTQTVVTDLSRNGYLALGYIADDVDTLPVPAYAGEGKVWTLDDTTSDKFEYTFLASDSLTSFGLDASGNNRWYNFYHADWDGPGSTYWQHDHVSVENGKLKFDVSRSPRNDKEGKDGVNSGVVSSHQQVVYPVFVEASVSVADISLASAFWLLSPDDTQEIDILEMYAGADNGNDYFSKLIHLSHHSFVRDPFQDYQPRDENSWWKSTIDGYQSWGEFGWNNGSRQYLQVGVNWVSPWQFEYFINGELVRVVYEDAFATKLDGEWLYTYPEVDTNGDIVISGYQSVIEHARNDDDFSFALLQEASQISTASVIDPYDYQAGQGFYKPADLIINMELQSWWTFDPTDSELADNSGKTTMLIDWVRVYNPK